MLEAGVRWEQDRPASKRNQGFICDGFKGKYTLPPPDKKQNQETILILVLREGEWGQRQ